MSRLLRGALACLAALAMAGAVAGSARAATQPIEGTWNFESGQVNVTPNADGTFTGTVVSPTQFSSCPHPAGDVIWQLSGSGDSYSGTHEWLNDPSKNCTPNGLGQATWTITDSSPSQETMTFCTAKPGTGAVDPAATPSSPAGTTLCYALTQAVSATQEPGVPANIAGPAISGEAAVGHTLTCSAGSWSNSPTGYAYSWQRGGDTIAGATSSTYAAQTADAGHTLTCEVIATNAGGESAEATSPGVSVASLTPPTSKTRSGCQASSVRLSGSRLGRVRLGMTRHAYRASRHRRVKTRPGFCAIRQDVRVGYATRGIDRTLSKQAAHRLRDRVIWVTTADVDYSVRGVHPGETLRTARRHLKLRKGLAAHHGTWYFIGLRRATVIVKVSHGKVRETGITERQLTHGRTRGALLKDLA